MDDDFKQKISIGLVPLACSDCGKSAFTLLVGHSSDGKTLLYTRCANQNCIDRKKESLGLDDIDGPESFMYWDEFDITDQGYDEDQLDIETEEDLPN